MVAAVLILVIEIAVPPDEALTSERALELLLIRFPFIVFVGRLPTLMSKLVTKTSKL